MELKPFNSRGQLHVFAASDRPTVIHSSNGKLLFSNVNLREVTHVAPFHCASFPDRWEVRALLRITVWGLNVAHRRLALLWIGVGRHFKAAKNIGVGRPH